jgi:hypothetical protein
MNQYQHIEELEQIITAILEVEGYKVCVDILRRQIAKAEKLK